MKTDTARRTLSIFLALVLVLTLTVPAMADPVDDAAVQPWDGVDMDALANGSIYFGKYDHAIGFSNWASGYPPKDAGYVTVTKEGTDTPILWRVMGSGAEGDSALTLLSEYILDAKPFFPYTHSHTGANPNMPEEDGNVNGWENSYARAWLNNSSFDGKSDSNSSNWAASAVDFSDMENGGFLNSFQASELSQIKTLNALEVKTNSTENPIKTISGDKIYLPGSNDVAKGNVTWDTSYDEDTLISSQVKLGYLKGGSTAYQWMLRDPNHVYPRHMLNLVSNTAQIGRAGVAYNFGVRPALKLNPQAIIFASEISGDSLGATPADGTNYVAAAGESSNYKLTLVNADTGTLGGVPAGEQVVSSGSNLLLQNLVPSETADNYTINYKIVSDGSIAGYGSAPASNADLSLNTSGLPEGRYKAYVWLQKNNADTSNEGSVPQYFPLSVTAAAKGESWYTDNPDAVEFIISTAEELAYLAAVVNSGTDYFEGKSVTLKNDIDLSAYENWTPIGAGYINGAQRYFKGLFDGAEHVISGLQINSTDGAKGLFGTVDKTGTVKNVIIKDCTILGGTYTGGLTGHINGIIENCQVSGSIEGTQYGSCYGGIAGYVNNSGIIRGSHSTVSISAASSIGGIAGYMNNGGLIQDCWNSGVIIASRDAVGGIAGYVNGASRVQGCYNSADVSTVSGAIGGIAGNLSNGIVEDCYSTGKVTGVANSGGIAGSMGANSTIRNCYTIGALDAGASVFAGGIVGGAGSGTVANCAALNPSIIVGNSNVGRIAGYTSNAKLTENFSWDGIEGTWANIASDRADGASKTGAELRLAETWSGFSAPIWEYSEGGLPVLKNINGTQSGDIPEYIGESEPTPKGPSISLTGDTAIAQGSDAAYALAVNNMEKLAAATVWFEVEDAYFSGKSFAGMNGFNMLGDVSWTQDGEKWTGRATLVNLTGGVTTDSALDIFEMIFASKGITGTTDVTITKIELSGYDEENNAVFIVAELANDTVQTVISEQAPAFDKYDVNRDGAVDQLDLTLALLYYMAEDGDDNWNAAKLADVNGDAAVTIDDYILILGNIAW